MGTQTKTAESERINSLIDGSRLLDDNLMTLVFDGNIEATQLVLNIILKRKDLTVKTVSVQKLAKNPLVGGYDVKLDIFAEDDEGNRFDVEVQRADEGASKERARFNSAVLDHGMLEHSQKFVKIKDSYVIFITENDVLKKGRALTHIERKTVEDDEFWGDGNHIIYANAAYPDTSNDIGKLMHDFRCRNAEDMFYKPLRDGVHHFKETEGGREAMSKDIENYGIEQRNEGKIMGAVSVYRDMNFTDQQIVEQLQKKFHLSKEEAEKYIEPAYA